MSRAVWLSVGQMNRLTPHFPRSRGLARAAKAVGVSPFKLVCGRVWL